MTRYRVRRLKREESAAALATSVALGAGVAAVAYYVVRLFLSREPLSGPEESPRALPTGGRDQDP